MARPKSEFLSGFGTALEIFKAVTDEVLKRGGSDVDLRRVISDSNLRGQIADLIVGNQRATERSTTRSTFKLAVNYDQTLAEMIAAGRYDVVNSQIIADHFPVTGSGQREIEVELFHFNCGMTSDQVLSELGKAGYRPGRIEELLALGAKHPDPQRQFPVVALGSLWRPLHGYRHVSSLDEWRGERQLFLRWFGDDWHEHCRFLAVRK